MIYTLFEDFSHFDLLPFTFTRPIYDLRTGIFTQQQRWSKKLQQPIHTQAYSYLGAHFDSTLPNTPVIWINGKMTPDDELLRLIADIKLGTYYSLPNGEIIVAHFSPNRLPADHDGLLDQATMSRMKMSETKIDISPLAIREVTDLFRQNDEWIALDFKIATQEAPSETIKDPYTRIYGKDNLYVSPGVDVKAAIINAENGPIYIGKSATIHEGAIIKNTHAIGDHASVNVGAKLRGSSSIGPYSKVGGEVTNSVLMGYSNKGHEGYLGNSVLGYWCNLGADTNTSNLKNNYAKVKLWHYPTERFRDTGLQFCGLMMGDHSKCGINTMFNTGTIIGVSANIFGSGFPRNYIPSFSWGGHAGFSTYRLSKAIEVAEVVIARRKMQLSTTEREILSSVFALTSPYRTWEKSEKRV